MTPLSLSTSRCAQAAARPAAPQAATQSNNTPRPFSWDLNPVALPQSQSLQAPVPGSHAGACLRPALTSWRDIEVLKKNQNPPGKKKD